MTLDDIMNPKTQMMQAKFNFAQNAVIQAYNLASKLGQGNYANIDDFFKVVDNIKARINSDLMDTLKLLEEQPHDVHKAKSAVVPHAA